MNPERRSKRDAKSIMSFQGEHLDSHGELFDRPADESMTHSFEINPRLPTPHAQSKPYLIAKIDQTLADAIKKGEVDEGKFSEDILRHRGNDILFLAIEHARVTTVDSIIRKMKSLDIPIRMQDSDGCALSRAMAAIFKRKDMRFESASASFQIIDILLDHDHEIYHDIADGVCISSVLIQALWRSPLKMPFIVIVARKLCKKMGFDALQRCKRTSGVCFSPNAFSFLMKWSKADQDDLVSDLSTTYEHLFDGAASSKRRRAETAGKRQNQEYIAAFTQLLSFDLDEDGLRCPQQPEPTIIEIVDSPPQLMTSLPSNRNFSKAWALLTNDIKLRPQSKSQLKQKLVELGVEEEDEFKYVGLPDLQALAVFLKDAPSQHFLELVGLR